MPALTSTEAAMAMAGETSSNEAHAAIETSTVPRQAARSRIECSGGPGRLARRMASMALMTCRCGRRPPGRHRSAVPPAPTAFPRRGDR